MIIHGIITPQIPEAKREISMYDGKRMAVVFRVGGHARVAYGRVVCDEDRDLGPVLRVQMEADGHDSPGQTTLILQKDSLEGVLRADDQYGCDLRLDLGPMPTYHKSRRTGHRRKVARKSVASA